MLKIIRRVFSFGDWSKTHPAEPPPGDWLDSQFDEIIDKIDGWDQRVRLAIKDDGKIAANAVDQYAIQPKVIQNIEKTLKAELEPAIGAAMAAQKTAETALTLAKAALNDAELLLKAAAATSGDIKAELTASAAKIAESSRLAAENIAKSVQLAAESAEIRTDWDDAASEAQAWALSSALWAEHMPDTLPDNAVKIMDISGDHWSSRWWANKAAAAFGQLSELYLGAHPVPPSSTSTGDVIPIGAIYYNTETGQMYVWDGSQWVSMTQPQRAGLATLWYNATEGQTAFPFATMDLNGRNYMLSIDATEGVDAHVNGVKVMPKEGPIEGDWTLNNATSTVTFLRPLRLGDIVSFDILMANEKLGPGEVNVWSMQLIEPQDGTRTAFTLDTRDAAGPAVTVNKNEELIVSLDGVMQEPAVSYSAAGSTITFANPPAADALVFLTWFRSTGGP